MTLSLENQFNFPPFRPLPYFNRKISFSNPIFVCVCVNYVEYGGSSRQARFWQAWLCVSWEQVDIG